MILISRNSIVVRNQILMFWLIAIHHWCQSIDSSPRSDIVHVANYDCWKKSNSSTSTFDISWWFFLRTRGRCQYNYLWRRHKLQSVSTHWGQDKMAAIFQMTLKCTFLNKNVWILIKISLKFVPKFLNNNITTLVQINAWRRPDYKSLSESMMLIYITWLQWIGWV